MQTAGIHLGRFGRAKAHVCRKENLKETLLQLQNACWLNELNDCDQTPSARQSAIDLKFNIAGSVAWQKPISVSYSSSLWMNLLLKAYWWSSHFEPFCCCLLVVLTTEVTMKYLLYSNSRFLCGKSKLQEKNCAILHVCIFSSLCISLFHALLAQAEKLDQKCKDTLITAS